jgi:hypothetical protein
MYSVSVKRDRHLKFDNIQRAQRLNLSQKKVDTIGLGG